MSMAISNKKSENNISFNNMSLTSVDNQTVIAGEQYSVPEIEVGFKCDYLKLIVNISTSDTELTTDDYKTVTAVYKIKYIDDEETNTTKEITECFSPKFQHEVDNKDTYTIIELPAKKIASINMTVYNNESTDISIDMARIYYSRLMDEETVKEMAGTGGGDVPVSNVLTLYNINNEYTIDGYNKSLILDLVVPDDILEQYGEKITDRFGDKYGTLETTFETNNTSGASFGYKLENTEKWIGDRKWTIKNSKITITSIAYDNTYKAVDGLFEIIVRINNNKQLYGKHVVEIKNSAVKDIYIKNISSEDGKLHINNDVTIDIGFLPENSYSAISGNFTLKSYDGTGAANNVYGGNDYHTLNSTLGNNFTLRGVSKGRVSLYLGNDAVHKQFIFDVVCNEDDRLTCTIETNTGLFEITQGGGQLEVYPRPNYDYYGEYSFSQVSIDGGSVTITDKGDYALITADEDGKLELICKPTYGPSASCEITVSGQYPEDVTFKSSDGTYKVNVGSQLLVDIEPTNNCRSYYDSYNHEISKIDVGVDYSIQSLNYGKTAKIIGKAVGSFSLNVLRTEDSKLLNSKVIEVVNESVVNIPLPDENCYWVLVKRTDEDYPILCYIDNASSAQKFIYKDGVIYSDNKYTKTYHYYLKDFAWEKRGEWDYSDDSICGSLMLIYDSCFDIYDDSGNLIINKTPSWEDVNLAKLVNKLKN